MFNSNNGYSLSDIAAITGNRNNNGDCFGGNGAWWIIILFLFVFCGWGNDNGNNPFSRGNNNGGGCTMIPQGNTTREEISYGFDMNGLENGIRGVQNGLCDGFYAMNTGMLNGFSELGNQVSNGFTNLSGIINNGFTSAELARCNSQAQLMAQLNQMNYNQQDCCCKTQTAIQGVNYNLSTSACDIQRAIADAARSIVDVSNANYRALHDENVAARLEAKDSQIAELTAKLNKADLAASQAAQSAYIINEVRPCPVPAYNVPNPYCNCANSYGFNNGCLCNNY